MRSSRNKNKEKAKMKEVYLYKRKRRRVKVFSIAGNTNSFEGKIEIVKSSFCTTRISFSSE